MKLDIELEILRIVDILKNDQAPDGSWKYAFETGISTDAYMIILLRTLGINDEELILELTERILSKQEVNGAWKLYHDEGNGNISATVEAYYSLLYSGYYRKEDKRLRAAKKFILSSGGIEKSHMFTKMMLALTGQYPWPAFFPIPVEIVLLPLSFPINFYDFSVFGRANLAPIMILADRKYSKKTKRSPNLTDLAISRAADYFDWGRTPESSSFFSVIKQGIKGLIGLPEHIHSIAIESTKKYMLDRLEPDGTFYSYFSSTFLMIFALLSLGYSKRDPIIIRAVNGLKAMKCKIDGHTHMQYTTASIWNTSLISYALQKAGISPSESVVASANRYLLDRQHCKFGDWAIHNPCVVPGGWGFSDVNTIHPDVDDTTATLRAFSKTASKETPFHQAWDRGINWLFSMQNNDGGWPAFEKNVDKSILNLLPIEGGKFLLTDPSSADLTGRTLEFFGGFTDLSKNHASIKRGVNWLIDNQEKDGSWYGRWGICYIYGTWAALTGMMAAGISARHTSIEKAVNWLHKIQNDDGGWGESCNSDRRNTYIPLGESTLTHTAWATDALISAADQPTKEIQAGIKFLLGACEKNDWTLTYPQGQGMAGGFYIHYHSYRYIFPLLALSHYKRKFQV